MLKKKREKDEEVVEKQEVKTKKQKNREKIKKAKGINEK